MGASIPLVGDNNEHPRAPSSVYLEGRNLCNKRYIANAASALYNPGSGRAIYGGMQVKW